MKVRCQNAAGESSSRRGSAADDSYSIIALQLHNFQMISEADVGQK